MEDTACTECHAEEVAEWTGTHHDLAMQPATEETVLGDFDDGRFEHFGVTTRFYRRDGRFFVETEGSDGELAEFEVAYVFGVEPLQQVLISFPGGRLQCLTVAWDTRAKRWFALYPDEKIGHDDPLHWTGRYQNWNAMCADCHSTHLEKNYDSETDTYRTSWVEIDVGCQACHGPGEAHVRWAEQADEGPYDVEDPKELQVVLRRGLQQEQIDTCAPCHSRRTRMHAGYEYGGAFLDTYLPERLHAGSYHADGQILDEVYVYGSFLQSRMHGEGVSCTDCHDPHTLELVRPGDVLCMQCHSPNAPLDRFPNLTQKEYDTREHHFHEPETEGSRCVDCHARERKYMVVDPRTDHSFRVPRPDLTARLGTPNACNDCHADQTAEWAVEQLRAWYGADSEPPVHFAEALYATRTNRRDAPEELARLAQDAEQPTIARATALDLMRGLGTAGFEARLAASADPDPLVRASAVRGIDSLPPEARAAIAVPLLEDPIRIVRIEAARALAGLNVGALEPDRREAFDAALEEYRAAQEVNADFPFGPFNLGVLAADQGRMSDAEAAYRRALELDPSFLPARFNLTNLLNTSGRNREAEEVLRDGIARAAIASSEEQGELHYSLGLLLAEAKRIEEAAASLEQAARLLPQRARVRYNYGLALQHLGRRDDAERVLIDANRVDPTDPSIVHAVAVLLMQKEDWERALVFAQRLVELAPEDPGAKQLLETVEAELGPR